MNNTVYDRFTALMQTVGLDGEKGSVKHAEVSAYCEALSLVQSAAEQALSEVFTDTMSEKGLQMYCDLLNIDGGETPQETKEKINSRLSQGFYTINYDEYRNAEKNTPGYNPSYMYNGETVTISPVNKESLAGLSNLIKNYYPAFFLPEFLGGGITFDYLDSLDYRWYETDRLALSFFVWERLGEKD